MTTPEYVAEGIAKSINKLEIGGQIAGDTKAEALRETLHGNYFELAALDGEVADLVCHALLIRFRPRAWATLVVARRHLGECTLARANSL